MHHCPAGSYCSVCWDKARTVRCAGCKKKVLMAKPSQASYERNYRCKDCCGFVCPVCGDRVVGAHLNYQARYSRYEACAACKQASGAGVVGGDLLKLAQASPATIMGAAQLARYAQELKLGNKLADGHYEALLTRAKRVIHDHMHVQDADKVALA